MAIFLNPDNANFNEAVHSKIYVDKTGLIEYTNSVLSTTAKFICNSRPRRFGKSMTVDMLCAYYSKGCESRELFRHIRFLHVLHLKSILINMMSFILMYNGVKIKLKI